MSALGQDATTDAMAALRADRPTPSPRLELP